VASIGANRGVPDVAAVANPQTGFPVVTTDAGGNDTIGGHGGTSASAPLWAGVIALADQYAGRHLGFVNPAIYRIAFAALALAGGTGVLLYLAAWLVLPEEGAGTSIATEILEQHRTRPWRVITPVRSHFERRARSAGPGVTPPGTGPISTRPPSPGHSRSASAAYPGGKA